MKRSFVLPLAALLIASSPALAAPEAPPAAPPASPAVSAPAPRTEAIHLYATPDAYKAACATTIEDVHARLAALEAYKGPAMIATVYKPYNEMMLELTNADDEASLLAQVHPSKAMRDQADLCDQDFSKALTDISLSRPLYDLIVKIDTSSSDDATKFSVFKTLRDFRRAGVDKDEATRAKIRALKAEETKEGDDFDRAISEDTRHIEVAPSALAGLPQDYIDAHKPGADGKVSISTEYPDYFPFMTYAKDDAARKALRTAERNRGYPANDATFMKLLKTRYALAQTLGYPDYATYITEDKMVGSPQKAQAFIDEINAVVKAPEQRDMAIVLARLKRIDPSAQRVEAWQYGYLEELVREEQYSLDSRELRSYFQFANVKNAVLKLAEDQFGLTIKPWTTPVWDPHVSAYEIYEGGKLMGRFYLDLHPRDGKYSHAAQFAIAEGIEGEQIPIAALVTNFPGAEDPSALMEHDDVVTFLHEFGHLLHHILGGHQAWVNNSGIATEWDFVEAPSQLREEWGYDYDFLKTFAVNDKGETIPKDLVARLNRARFFGMGIDTATQVFYASLSLDYYSHDPSSFALLPEMMKIENAYSPFPYTPGTHFYDSFEHLNGYSAMYYTYQWSLAIAQDMFTRFKAEGLANPEVNLAYRQDILEPGGSAPAAELVQRFLGRPWSTDAYKAFLNRTE